MVFSCILLLLFSVTLASCTQNCPDLYKRYSSRHTFCLPPNRTCTIVKRGVCEKDKELILNVHNDYRSKIASGRESRAGGMPPAKNMLEMVWDNELAAVAQKLAETCKYGHDCNNCRKVQAFPVGQNIGESVGLSRPIDSANWKGFIDNLYSEVSLFNKRWIKPYVEGPQVRGKEYGHFTQIAWATSWKIGCGWTLFKTGRKFTSYMVCNYGPAGNTHGGEMYKAGPTGSACPDNSCCGNKCKQSGVNSKYPALCKVINTSSSPEGPGPHGGKFRFFCDFNKQPDCATSVQGKAWTTVKTSGGNWLSAVLKGGEQTKLTFSRKFPTSGEYCVKVLIRSGPNVDGQAERGKGASCLDTGSYKTTYNLDYSGVPKENRQDFMSQLYGFNANGKNVQYVFSFNVPSKSPDQFVEIKGVSVYDGECVD